MTIDLLKLVKDVPSELLVLSAEGSGTLTSGEEITIQAGATGNTGSLLYEKVPLGKQWQLRIHIEGEETDL